MKNSTIYISKTKVFLVLILFSLLQLTGLNAANKKPVTIPTLKQWKGGKGIFKINSSSRICVYPKSFSELARTANEFKTNLEALTGLKLKVIKASKPKSGDFFLTLKSSGKEIGDEGYIFKVGSSVTIQANKKAGVAFGTMTALQVLAQHKSKKAIPKGVAKDYPDYKVRGFLVDAGRYYYPPEYLKELVKQMAYFKLNEFHFHPTENAGYRFESKKYPKLTHKKHYSNAYINELVDFANSYGVKVIPELDTPGHSAPMVRLKPELTKNNNLDLNNPGVVPFIQSLYDELLPLFPDYAFHIGCDEFGGPGSLEKYIEDQSKYMLSKGKQVRIWTGFHDITKFSNKVVIDVWNHSDQVNKYIANGNYVINSLGTTLYTVPGTGWYPPLEVLYNVWDPTKFIVNKRSLAKVDTQIKDASKLLGAKMHIWNDLVTGSVELHDQMIQPMLRVLSEKVWGKGSSASYKQFEERAMVIGNVPGVSLITPPKKYETKDPGDLAAKKPTHSSSHEGSFENSTKAVDVWPWTMWKGGANDWMYVDLETSAKVNRVVVDFGHRNLGKYKIQVSNNKTKWIDVLNVTGSSGQKSDKIFKGVKARYVKIMATGKGMSIYNLEVYGDKPSGKRKNRR